MTCTRGSICDLDSGASTESCETIVKWERAMERQGRRRSDRRRKRRADSICAERSAQTGSRCSIVQGRLAIADQPSCSVSTVLLPVKTNDQLAGLLSAASSPRCELAVIGPDWMQHPTAF